MGVEQVRHRRDSIGGAAVRGKDWWFKKLAARASMDGRKDRGEREKKYVKRGSSARLFHVDQL
jgi:hypothetical protein